MAQANRPMEPQLSKLPSSVSTSTEGDLQDAIALLQKNVSTLRSRCACLEAQNILVSVQQLDIAARFISWVCTALSLVAYLRLSWWLIDRLPSLLASIHTLGETFTLWPFQATDPWWVSSVYGIWLLRLAVVIFPYYYNKNTYGVFHRRFEVFAVAFIVISRTKLVRWRERTFPAADIPENEVRPFGEDSQSEDAIWDANYEISARFLYVSILRLKGLWTKTAQYLSSRADFMPAAYVRELKRLQDQAPATPWEEISLPRHVADALQGIDTEPLASASIGQVHVAHVGEQKVVVKVQHPSARTLMTDDFWSLKVIARIVAWMEPEYEFLEILMREWAVEARKELNFLTEASNLQEAQRSIDQMMETSTDGFLYTNPMENAESFPFQVEIPHPLLHLTTKDVLVMSFCEGVRVDDFEMMEKNGLQRDTVMDAVAQTFSHMMYVSDIFNGDPHAGNLFLRAGCKGKKKEGFTLVLLDWGLAKRLPTEKRVAFCQMAYAAATLDFGLLLDSQKTVGLKMKRENVAEDMEGLRFFLRDIAPSKKARKRIKAKLKTDKARMNAKKKREKVPMESKAYPGEFFFFVRVNELLHGLGSRMSIEMAYLDVVKPYAERGLRQSALYKDRSVRDDSSNGLAVKDTKLNAKIESSLTELRHEGKIDGVQVCVLDKKGECLVNLVQGTLGGLKRGSPMQQGSLVLGFSCTKAVTATLAHLMVQEGYLSYDEPICERVWRNFCPTPDPPRELAGALDIPTSDVRERWGWKRRISLRHILSHKAGLFASLPHKLAIKTMASCEYCSAAYEYNSDAPEATILPTQAPGSESQYHFLSFGWLVAGALCGAYKEKHKLLDITFEQVYSEILGRKLSAETLKGGFHPCGCGTSCDHPLAQVVTADVSLSTMLQRRREMEAMGEGMESGDNGKVAAGFLDSFRGKEFLLDSRIWNCSEAIGANVPAAGGRFSALGLAHFYHDLGNSGKILNDSTLELVATQTTDASSVGGLQGASVMAHDGDEKRTSLGLGFQLIRFDRDDENKPSAFGHAGIGGSIGLHHRASGLSIALMTNKADGGSDVTMGISKVIMEHFDL